MKRLVSILMIVTAFAFMTACGHKAKVISEDKFISIYMDMFIADQWLEANYTERKAADTLLFYDPIFERYGYDREDYFKTVDYYLQDPQKYVRVVKKVQARLEDRVKDVQTELEISAERERNRPKDIGVVRFSEAIKKLPFLDTIFIQKNDQGIYSIMPIEFDTIFKGPEIVIREKIDTTASDSLAVDSLSVDTVAVKLNTEDDEDQKMEVAPLIDEVRVKPMPERPVRNPKAGIRTSNRNAERLPLEDLKK